MLDKLLLSLLDVLSTEFLKVGHVFLIPGEAVLTVQKYFLRLFCVDFASLSKLATERPQFFEGYCRVLNMLQQQLLLFYCRFLGLKFGILQVLK